MAACLWAAVSSAEIDALPAVYKKIVTKLHQYAQSKNAERIPTTAARIRPFGSRNKWNKTMFTTTGPSKRSAIGG